MSFQPRQLFKGAAKIRAAASRPAFRRWLHAPRPLHLDVDKGLGDFLTPAGLRTIAVDWQHGMLKRLNDLIRDTDLEDKSLVQTVMLTAGDEDRVMEFNYASQLLNNSFFLDSLDHAPGERVDLYKAQFRHIATANFGSLENMKNSMIAAAMGMTTSGWLWLVVDGEHQLGIVATFGAGTLLVRSRQQRIPPQRPIPRATLPARNSQSSGVTAADAERQSNIASPTSGVARPPPPLNPHSPSRAASNNTVALADANPSYVNSYKSWVSGVTTDPSERGFSQKTGETLNPLLCISIHEHAWLGSDYGIWGKEEYLKRFWSVVDWAKVAENYMAWTPTSQNSSITQLKS
ncbi:manganese and iron superoxide dismutase [Sistotremastrum suecicum HHB10207 ss-3]|uniref:Manganese and iron superoxide dismutase n=1 Tax=Sistotremastrum suecicum HHB10207 ss-3 TaxID=1314776 RepID=A0A166FYJ0_9AGAM|nr:manganese and iron superoxide dismutase [Sistotremastrum suecicum HHB10207 ss-3]